MANYTRWYINSWRIESWLLLRSHILFKNGQKLEIDCQVNKRSQSYMADCLTNSMVSCLKNLKPTYRLKFFSIKKALGRKYSNYTKIQIFSIPLSLKWIIMLKSHCLVFWMYFYWKKILWEFGKYIIAGKWPFWNWFVT